MTKDNLSPLREGVNKLQEALSVLQSGPLDFYVAKALASYKLLTTKYSPFLPGDVARLVKPVDFKENYGFAFMANKLTPGVLLVVVSVDVNNSKNPDLTFRLKFLGSNREHEFYLSGDYLEKTGSRVDPIYRDNSAAVGIAS